MIMRKSHKKNSTKNMIIELGLVFQNLKLANEMNVLAIGTKMNIDDLMDQVPPFRMFKYFLNMFRDLVLKVHKSCYKIQAIRTSLNCKESSFWHLWATAGSTRPV